MTLITGACADEFEPALSVMDEPTGPVLRISTGSSFSRADEHPDDVADDPYSERAEEAINRVDLFFFASEQSTAAPFFTYEVKNVSKATYADLTVKVPMELADKFEDDKAYIYALVNLPDDVTVSYVAKDGSNGQINGKAATLRNLKEVWVDSSVDFVAAGGPSSFVMRGGQTVDLLGSKDGIMTVSGVILLERLASKIRLWASIPDEIYVDENGKTIYQKDGESDADFAARKQEGVKWTPVPENSLDGSSNVRLYLYNLATRSRIDSYIGGDLENRADLGFDNIDRRNEYEKSVRLLVDEPELREADKDDSYPYSHSVAYYSYPNIWDASKPSEEHQTYLVISMPWTSEDEDGNELFQVCYYLVPVNALKGSQGTAERLDPNRYYRIKIHLGMLGSKNLGDPIEVEASCEVVDWRKADVEVRIKDRRYLVINEKNWTMNNESLIEIPFSSSHPVSEVFCYVNYFRYNDRWGTAANTNNEHNQAEFGYWVGQANGAEEVLITATPPRNSNTAFDGKANDVLYYKKKYFYDQYYGGYTYYVGHEHPKTFHPDHILYNNGSGMTADEKNLWKDYIDTYGLEQVYKCTIDNNENIIRFEHPLIQWEEKRGQINGANQLQYYYPAKNKRTGKIDAEFSRCEVIIKIRHADYTANDGLFEETVYITQYPGMYVDVSHNYGTVATWGTVGNSSEVTKLGNIYTFVNGYSYGVATTSGRTTYYQQNHDDCWSEVNELSNYYDSNTNPNMYVITTTQLSEDNAGKYIIGDPRTLYYNNNLSTSNDTSKGTKKGTNNVTGNGYDYPLTDTSSNESHYTSWKGTNKGGLSYDNRINVWKGPVDYEGGNNGTEALNSARSLYNEYGDNCLSSYYPTDESEGPGSKESFVAPKFRIASSYGRVAVNGRTEMRRRCAAYQEAGRPAGRWRLPTKAEVKYIAQLSADNKIPILFGSTKSATQPGYYWTANGGLKVYGDNNGTCIDENYGDPGVDNAYPAGLMATRCVYDEWYWTEIDGGEFHKSLTKGPLTTDYWWGDKKKDNTQPKASVNKNIKRK
ncbi:MAG: hypothetical protein J1F05_04475 [Muribaculaceae bacterium]|nr:hypothetical protein [Muribaculaceae bacterium]